MVCFYMYYFQVSSDQNVVIEVSLEDLSEQSFTPV